MEILRALPGVLDEVAPGLWVGPQSARALQHLFVLVVDCRGSEAVAGDRVFVPRSGKKGNLWEPADFDEMVEVVTSALGHGPVLIHCRVGRSRSVTAAAAVLLATGRASDPDEAYAMVQLRKGGVGELTRRCLLRWWKERVLMEV